jgi:O-antigen ligase
MENMRKHLHSIWSILPLLLLIYTATFGANVAGLFHEPLKIFSLVLLVLVVAFAFRRLSPAPSAVLPLTLLLTVMCISMLLSPSYLGAWLVLLWAGVVIVFWMSAAVPVDQLERALMTTIAVMALVALYDVLEWELQNGFPIGAPVRPSSTLSNPNVVAPVMMIGMALAFHTRRLVWLAVFTLVLVLTGSRAAFLATAIGAGILAIARVKRLRLNWKHLVVGLTTAVALLPLLLLQVEHPTHAPANTRFDLWRVAAITFSQHPLLGIGPERYREAFLDLAQVQHNVNHTHAHNTYLQVAAETGVLGLLALGGLIITATQRIWRGFRSGDRHGAPIAAALMAGLLVHGVLDYVYWVLALVLMALWAGRLLLTPRAQTCTLDTPEKFRWRHAVTLGLVVLGYPAMLLAHHIERHTGWLYVGTAGMAVLLTCAHYAVLSPIQTAQSGTGGQSETTQHFNIGQTPTLFS